MKKYNYIITVKSETTSNVVNISQKLSKLLPDADWIENTPSLLLKQLDTEAIHTAMQTVGGKSYFIDYKWEYDYIKGSPEWLRQQLRKLLFPGLSDSLRTQLFLFLGGLLVQTFALISIIIEKTNQLFIGTQQILLEVAFFVIVFLLRLFYAWVFSEEESKKHLMATALILALFAIVMARLTKKIMLLN